MDNLNLDRISEERHSLIESRVHTHQSCSQGDASSSKNTQPKHFTGQKQPDSFTLGRSITLSQIGTQEGVEDGSSPTFKMEAKHSYESFGPKQTPDNRPPVTKVYDASQKNFIASQFDSFQLEPKPSIPQNKPSSTFKDYKLSLASPRGEQKLSTPRSLNQNKISPASSRGKLPLHPTSNFKQYKFGTKEQMEQVGSSQQLEKPRSLKYSSSFASGYQLRAIDEQSAKMSNSQFSNNQSITSLSRRPRVRALPSQFRQDQKKKLRHNSIIDGLDLGGSSKKEGIISKKELLESAKNLDAGAKPGKKQGKDQLNATFSQFTSLAEATVFMPDDTQNKIGNLTKFKDGKDMLSNTLGSADLAKLLPFANKQKKEEEKKEGQAAKLTFQERYGGLGGGKSLMPIIEDEDDDVGMGGFAVGLTNEQKAAITDTTKQEQIGEMEIDLSQENDEEEPWKAVKHDAAYLRRLRLTKSAEKLRPTMEKKLRDKSHFLYDPPCFEDDDIEGEVPRVEAAEFRPRKKSESDTSLFTVLYFSKFQQHLHLQCSLVKTDLIELRAMLSDLLKKEYRMNCYKVMLLEVKNLIDFFLDQPYKDVLQLKTMKEIQAKMDQILVSFDKQLSEQAKLPEASPSMTKSTEAFTQAKMTDEERKVQEIKKNFLSLNEIYNVKFFFRHFVYQLSKMQEHLQLADKMNHGHRRYKATLKKTGAKKPKVGSAEPAAATATSGDDNEEMADFDPNMTIGQGQTMMFGRGQNLMSQTLTLGQGSRGGGSSTPSEFQYMFRVDFKYQKLFKSRHTVISLMKPSKTPIGEPINVEKLMGEFPLEYKLRVIAHQLELKTKKWKEDFLQNREKNMQVMVCNICSKTIYTQLVEEHSKACIEKLQKIKNQRAITTDFLKIQNEGTDALLQVEKNRQERLNQATLQQTPAASQRELRRQLLPTRRTSVMQTLRQKPRTLESDEGDSKAEQGLNCLQKIANIGKKRQSINPLTDSASQLGLPSSRQDSQSRKLSGSLNRKPSEEEKTSRKLTDSSQVFLSIQNTSMQKTLRIGPSDKDSSKLFFDAIQGSQPSDTQLNPIQDPAAMKRKNSIPPVDLQRLQNSIVKQRQQEDFIGAESECMDKSPKYQVLKSQVNVPLVDVSLIDFTSSKRFRQVNSQSRRFMSTRYNSARKLLGGDVGFPNKRRRRGSHQFNNLRLNDLDTMKCVKNMQDVKKTIIPSMKNDLFSFEQLVKQTREQGEIADIQMWQSLCLYTKEAKQFLIRHKLKEQQLFTHKRLQGQRKIYEKLKKIRNRDKMALGSSFLKRVQDNDKLEFRLIRDPSQKDSVDTPSPAPESVHKKPSFRNSMSHLTMKSSEIRRKSYRFQQTNLKINEKDIQMLMKKEVQNDLQSDFRPKYQNTLRKPSLRGSSQTVNVQQQKQLLQRGGPEEEDLRSIAGASQMSQATRAMDRHRRRQNRLLRAEADLIGELKSIAQKCFEMSQRNYSFKRQIEVFNGYSAILKDFKDENPSVFKELDNEVVEFFSKMQRKVNTKIRELKVIHQLHQDYMKTMPKAEVNAIDQEIKVHQHDFDPYMEYASTATERLSIIKKAVEIIEEFDTPKPSRIFSRKNSCLPPPLTRKNSIQKCFVGGGLLGNKTNNDRSRIIGGADFNSAVNNLTSPIDTSAFSMQQSGRTPSDNLGKAVDELSLPSQGSDSKTNKMSGLEQAESQPISSPSISRGSIVRHPTSSTNVRGKDPTHAGMHRFAGNLLEEESESDNNSDKQQLQPSSRTSLKNPGTQRSSQGRLQLSSSRGMASVDTPLKQVGQKPKESGNLKQQVDNKPGAPSNSRKSIIEESKQPQPQVLHSVPHSSSFQVPKQVANLEKESAPTAPVAPTAPAASTKKKQVSMPQRSLQVAATSLESPGLPKGEDKAETPQVAPATHAMTTQVFEEIEDFTPLSEVKANLDAMAGESIRLKSSKDSMFLQGRSGSRQNDISVDEFNIPDLSDGNDSMDEESMNELAMGGEDALSRRCPQSGVPGKGLVFISELQSRPSQSHISSARQNSGQISKKS